MRLHMKQSADRRRIATFLRAALGWKGMTGVGLTSTGRISRATIDRVKRGDPNVSDTMLRALGDALDLPRDFLIYVGEGDLSRINRATDDPDLIRWTTDLILGEPSEDGGSNP